MKMEVRVFPNSPIITDEITAWFESIRPRVVAQFSIVEREGENRTAVYALILDPVGEVGETSAGLAARGTARVPPPNLEIEALLELLNAWTIHGEKLLVSINDTKLEELIAKSAELRILIAVGKQQ